MAIDMVLRDATTTTLSMTEVQTDHLLSEEILSAEKEKDARCEAVLCTKEEAEQVELLTNEDLIGETWKNTTGIEWVSQATNESILAT